MKRLLLFFFVLSAAFIMARADEMSNMRFRHAVNLYNSGKYENAATMFKNALESCSPDSITLIQNWIAKCKNVKPQSVKQKKLELDKVEIKATENGGEFEININATSTWNYTRRAGWYRLMPFSNKLIINIPANNMYNNRCDTIDVTMEDMSTQVVIEQSGVNGIVYFNTTPDFANVQFLDNHIAFSKKSSSEKFDLPSGKYSVRISKGGYESVDTVVSVPDSGEVKPLVYDIKLKPKFGMLKLRIDTQRGSNFTTWPKMRIGTHDVDIETMFGDGTDCYSFNNDNNVVYYHLYEGNIVPLEEGLYDIKVTAPGFENYSRSLTITDGETTDLVVTMRPFSGFLTVSCNDFANGARIYVDNYDIGIAPVTNLPIAEGTHCIRFEKEGLTTKEDSINFEIKKDVEYKYNLEMYHYIKGHITSSPQGADVYVDDKFKGHTPLNVNFIKDPEQKSHKLEISMGGYFPVTKDVEVQVGIDQTLDVELEKITPLKVVSDESNLYLKMTRGEEVVCEDILLPSTVDIPLGKYKVELFRKSQKHANNGEIITKKKRAYKTTYNHNGRKETLKMLSYSRSHYHILGGTLNLTSYKGIGENGDEMYKMIGSAYLGQMKLFPGFSTHFIKASFFSISDDIKNKTVNANPEYYADTKYPEYMMGFTCVFLNADFRMGGALHKNIDVSVLGSYSWMPPLYIFLPLSHVDGHDLFVGAEFTSRLPVFNFSIRAGYQMMRGNYNVKCENVRSDYSKLEKSFHHTPFTADAFVIALNINLGGKDSKGNNVLRLW